MLAALRLAARAPRPSAALARVPPIDAWTCARASSSVARPVTRPREQPTTPVGAATAPSVSGPQRESAGTAGVSEPKSKRQYIAQIQACTEKRHIRSVYRKLLARGGHPFDASVGERVYAALVPKLASLGATDQALEAFTALRARGYTGGAVFGPMVFNSMLKLWLDQGRVDSAHALQAERRAAGVPETTATHNIWLAFYARRGDLDALAAEVTRMERTGQAKDIYTYNTLLRAYLGAARHELAARVFQTMVESSVAPDAVTYTTMIAAALGRSDLDAAAALVQSMLSSSVEPNVGVYTTLVNQLLKANAVEMADALVTRMRARGIEPNVVTHTTFIAHCFRTGRVDEALARLDRMRAQGVQPNLVTLSLVLREHVRSGAMARAAALVEQMRAGGLEPDVVVYTTLIQGWLAAGERGKATDVLSTMVDAKIAIDAKPFCELVRAHVRAGDATGLAAVRAAMSKRGLRLSLAEYRNKTHAAPADVIALAELLGDALERQDVAFYVSALLRVDEPRARALIPQLVASGRADKAALDAAVRRFETARERERPSAGASGSPSAIL